MPGTLRIDARYAGPPDSGNGGVSCGLLAEHLESPVVEVTLRRPPPLDTDLRVEDGNAYDGDVLVATAVPSELDVALPAPVTVDVAAAAAPRFPGHVAHPFPGCFVCGTQRSDGLQLQPGPVAPGVVAAVWTPEATDRFLVWAALDCPGGWVGDLPGRPILLGRMALEHLGTPTVGHPHVVMGQHLRTEGRKTFSSTALYDADGRLLARAGQTWITLAS